jgi:hypothetical protein
MTRLSSILAPLTLTLALTSTPACRTTGPQPDAPDVKTNHTTNDPQDPRDDVADSPGPFEVAERWIEAREPTSDVVESVASTWPKPWIERMHREGAGYRALVLGGEEPAEGILLTVQKKDESWAVTAAKVVPSDYLWPTK